VGQIDRVHAIDADHEDAVRICLSGCNRHRGGKNCDQTTGHGEAKRHKYSNGSRIVDWGL
jgi:hypothetical protein